jgi:hypothetical protein
MYSVTHASRLSGFCVRSPVLVCEANVLQSGGGNSSAMLFSIYKALLENNIDTVTELQPIISEAAGVSRLLRQTRSRSEGKWRPL